MFFASELSPLFLLHFLQCVLPLTQDDWNNNEKERRQSLFSGRNSELAVVMEVEMTHVTVTDTSSTKVR